MTDNLTFRNGSSAFWFRFVTAVTSTVIGGRAHPTFTSELKPGTFSSLKWLHSKQPNLGLMHEFVVDCAHVLCVVHTTKKLVSLMLLKGFLSDSFIYFMYRMSDENFE